MTLPAADVVLTEDADKVLSTLETSRDRGLRAIARRIRAYRPLLLVDCLHGEVVRRGSIPSELVRRYGVENLYVEDLPSFWRLLYTVVRRNSDRHVVILAIISHRDYSKLFPGRQG
jgi:hypothetical protein